eukprot:CAMPEP_0175047604 /NCGR_PEP_ID=MMETSP0052_2-20121109/5697_1 /TAXON_ID=51329 ORGANISM="Polytomella parva, Strain SAG 63-3" /NCGR_SAMPLE_ID=MMETSP0052_2 /ASSEMBLY_ACC=CAM_ASM_000194 /LENGTH=656 /DNA_ID=CAMNT_0016311517 /DNA_START=18 /DNA_END=1984 /DNA_ORIENTATION=-
MSTAEVLKAPKKKKNYQILGDFVEYKKTIESLTPVNNPIVNKDENVYSVDSSEFPEDVWFAVTISPDQGASVIKAYRELYKARDAYKKQHNHITIRRQTQEGLLNAGTRGGTLKSLGTITDVVQKGSQTRILERHQMLKNTWNEIGRNLSNRTGRPPQELAMQRGPRWRTRNELIELLNAAKPQEAHGLDPVMWNCSLRDAWERVIPFGSIFNGLSARIKEYSANNPPQTIMRLGYPDLDLNARNNTAKNMMANNSFGGDRSVAPTNMKMNTSTFNRSAVLPSIPNQSNVPNSNVSTYPPNILSSATPPLLTAMEGGDGDGVREGEYNLPMQNTASSFTGVGGREIPLPTGVRSGCSFNGLKLQSSASSLQSALQSAAVGMGYPANNGISNLGSNRNAAMDGYDSNLGNNNNNNNSFVSFNPNIVIRQEAIYDDDNNNYNSSGGNGANVSFLENSNGEGGSRIGTAGLSNTPLMKGVRNTPTSSSTFMQLAPNGAASLNSLSAPTASHMSLPSVASALGIDTAANANAMTMSQANGGGGPSFGRSLSARHRSWFDSETLLDRKVSYAPRVQVLYPHEPDPSKLVLLGDGMEDHLYAMAYAPITLAEVEAYMEENNPESFRAYRGVKDEIEQQLGARLEEEEMAHRQAEMDWLATQP